MTLLQAKIQKTVNRIVKLNAQLFNDRENQKESNQLETYSTRGLFLYDKYKKNYKELVELCREANYKTFKDISFTDTSESIDLDYLIDEINNTK